MKKIIITVLLLSSFRSNAQQYTQLRVGDRIPDIILKNMVNYKTASVHVRDLGSKLVILDFWSIWCAPCVAAFPKMEALNKQFNNQLQVIAVSFNNPLADVKEFIAKRKGTAKEIRVPVSIQRPGIDTILEKLFPAGGFPHEVWINDKGIVKAITSADYVTAENVRHMLGNDNFSLPGKNHQPDFSIERPFLINGNGGADSAFTYRSLVSNYIDSISDFGLLKQRDDRYTRLFIANETVIDMLKSAASMLDTNLRKLPFDRLNKHVVASMQCNSKYGSPSIGSHDPDSLRAWQHEHLFCYELILPPSFSLKRAYQKMISDIEYYFGVKAEIREEVISCLSLRVVDSSKLNYAKNGKGILYYDEENHYHLRFDNREVSNITDWINGLFNNLPVAVDDTGITGMVNMDITVAAPYDLSALQQALEGTGLAIIQTEEKITVLKISGVD